jgi:hypothetical protein
MADRCYKHKARACKTCTDHQHVFSAESTYSGGDWYCYCGSILPPGKPGEIKP